MDTVTSLLTLGSTLTGVGGGLVATGKLELVITGLVAFVLAGACFFLRETFKV